MKLLCSMTAGGLWIIVQREELRRRVLAPLRAARLRPFVPLVRTAFIAELRRAAAPRRLAAECACLDSDAGEAALWPSLFRARLVARGRGAGGLRREWPCPFR